jgi:hypothetical protein
MKATVWNDNGSREVVERSVPEPSPAEQAESRRRRNLWHQSARTGFDIAIELLRQWTHQLTALVTLRLPLDQINQFSAPPSTSIAVRSKCTLLGL